MVFADDARTVVDYLAHYMAESVAKEHPVVRLEPMAELVERLELNRFVQIGLGQLPCP